MRFTHEVGMIAPIFFERQKPPACPIMQPGDNKPFRLPPWKYLTTCGRGYKYGKNARPKPQGAFCLFAPGAGLQVADKNFFEHLVCRVSKYAGTCCDCK